MIIVNEETKSFQFIVNNLFIQTYSMYSLNQFKDKYKDEILDDNKFYNASDIYSINEMDKDHKGIFIVVL